MLTVPPPAISPSLDITQTMIRPTTSSNNAADTSTVPTLVWVRSTSFGLLMTMKVVPIDVVEREAPTMNVSKAPYPNPK